MSAEEGTFSISQDITVQIRQETQFMVTVRDWKRLRNNVSELGGQRSEYSAVAWACVGLVGSAGFAAIGWAPAYKALSAPASVEFAWIWPVIIASGVSMSILGAAMFRVARQTATDDKASAKQIVSDMDEVHDLGDPL